MSSKLEGAPVPESDDHLVRFAAREYATALSELRADMTRTDAVTASRVVRYARRADRASDLEIERALKKASGLRRIYTRALERLAQAHSPRAAAAASGEVERRKLGAHIVEVIDESSVSYLVIRLSPPDTRVSMIEVRDAAGQGGRYKLGPAIGGIIQQRLDEGDRRLSELKAALLEPDTQVYLL